MGVMQIANKTPKDRLEHVPPSEDVTDALTPRKGKVIVLGGYGLIGSACVKALRTAGFHVTAIGRSAASVPSPVPLVDWVIRDVTKISVDEWRALLSGVDVIVNASGALQDGSKDDLEAIHVTTINKLVQGSVGLPVRIVQISAAGVSDEASTRFFRSKARGDAIIREKAADWVILRPTLVLSPEAYGGTALLRAASALPLVVPKVFPNSPVQTVYVGDVADAVVSSAIGDVPSGTVADLTETGTRSLPDLLHMIRRWQGYPKGINVTIPALLLTVTSRIADFLDHLGWHSALRSTSMITLKDGVKGDPATWLAAGGKPCRSLPETLHDIPSTRQERLFARAYFMIPASIAILSIFWVASGLIALAQPSRAMAVLTERGIPADITRLIVMGGALVDLALGIGILWKRWCRQAAIGMAVVAISYAAGSLFIAPDLWLDPVGPMLKVLPGIMLAVSVWMLVEER